MGSQTAQRNGAGIQLAIFPGAEEDGDYRRQFDTDSAPTLSEFYYHYVEPNCLLPDAAPRNLDEYRRAIRRWVEYTGDPLLEAIDQTTCSIFLTELSKRPGQRGAKRISPNTVRKTCRHLQRCLDLAGPPGRENRLGQDLYGEEEISDGNGNPSRRVKSRPIPFLKQPRRKRKPAEDLFSLEELDRWLAAFPRATRPQLRGVRPGQWWTSLVLVIYNTGMRIGTALLLRWGWIRGPWLMVPVEAVKGHDDRRIWINPAAQTALDLMRPADPSGQEERLIFPWPHHRRYLDTVRENLLRLADIDPAGHGFHALKKSLTTYLMGIDSGIAQMIAGHGDLKTTVESYTHPELARMAEVMAQVPQPDTSRVDPQRRLF